MEVDIHDQQPAPQGRTATRVAVARPFAGEDWRDHDRISFWIRPEMSGFKVFPLVVVFRNEGGDEFRYRCEDDHYVTVPIGQWTHVVWEIEPLARDRVTSLEFHYWLNKSIPDPSDRVAFELGGFDVLDFSEIHAPGNYVLRAGGTKTRPFRIDRYVWRETIWKSINFFHGERYGIEIPGIHEACHHDWQAVHGDQTIIMNGAWHNTGGLSQGAVNTAEATYALFALAEGLQARGEDPVLLERSMNRRIGGSIG